MTHNPLRMEITSSDEKMVAMFKKMQAEIAEVRERMRKVADSINREINREKFLADGYLQVPQAGDKR